MDRAEAYYDDALRAIGLIEAFLEQGKVTSISDYRKHDLVKSAVERQLGIIGEAVNNIRKLDSAHMIPEADRIVSFRNRLIHSYETIEDEFVWPILMKHLPLLKEAIMRRKQP
ncbi:MAG: DUF86 domain-containing protein [Flavobacteriales bacterium]|nr:DUF86 domain-containing protein [Flavobacteriales bacterium]